MSKRFIEQALRMVEVTSESTGGNEELVNYAGGLAQSFGLEVKTQQVFHSIDGVSKRQFNLIAILGDSLVDIKTRRGIMFSSHLDTVGPGMRRAWSETGGDPYKAALKGDRLYGLGASDGKLDFLCKLYAIQKFRETKLRMPIYLVGTCGEELGLFGARYLIQSKALNPKYVVVGKPTDLRVVTSHKSSNVFRISIAFHTVERGARGFNRRAHIVCTGRTGHSAFPVEADNAIYTLFALLDQGIENGFDLKLSKFEGGGLYDQTPDYAHAECFLTSHQVEDFKRFFRESVQRQNAEQNFVIELGGLGDTGISFFPDELFRCFKEINTAIGMIAKDLDLEQDNSFDPPASTVTATMLKQAPSRLEAFYDIRLLPDVDSKLFNNKMRNILKEIASRYPSLSVDMVLERKAQEFIAKPDGILVQTCGEALEAAGLMPNIGTTSLVSEAGLYSAADFETVVFGPGSHNYNIHAANEYAIVGELQGAIQFYTHIIEKLCK